MPPAHIDGDSQPLGKQSDTSLVKVLGVSASAVKWPRDKRGITSFSSTR